MNDGSKAKGTYEDCPICGKRFRRKTDEQITCGKSCAAYWREQKRREEKRGAEKKPDKGNCQICGRSLNTFCGNARKYCSKKCRAEADKQRAREKAKEKQAQIQKRECEWCGKLYAPRYKTQRFCSRYCSTRYRAAGMWKTNQLKSKEVLLIVTKEVPVHPQMKPEVGKVYQGKECWAQSGRVFIIPEIGKYGLLIRENEAKVVQRE